MVEDSQQQIDISVPLKYVRNTYASLCNIKQQFIVTLGSFYPDIELYLSTVEGIMVKVVNIEGQTIDSQTSLDFIIAMYAKYVFELCKEGVSFDRVLLAGMSLEQKKTFTLSMCNGLSANTTSTMHSIYTYFDSNAQALDTIRYLFDATINIVTTVILTGS